MTPAQRAEVLVAAIDRAMPSCACHPHDPACDHPFTPETEAIRHLCEALDLLLTDGLFDRVVDAIEAAADALGVDA